MKVTWLGQSGYVFEYKGQRLVVDPYLSDIVFEKEGLKRMINPPLSVDELKPDYVFITHDHIDHFDPVTMPFIHEKFPLCEIAGPESVMRHCHRLNFNKAILTLVTKGQRIVLGEFIIHVTPAYHSDPFAVGFIIETAGIVVYISGDTLYEEALASEILSLAPRPIDVAFVVINGKLNNMGIKDAVHLIKDINTNLAIPMHYGMFLQNTADPNAFLTQCNENEIKAMELVTGKETAL